MGFTSCKSYTKPLPTKISKKVRNKAKDNDDLQVTVKAKPLSTKVSTKVKNKTKDDDNLQVLKKVRNKTKDDDDLQITVDKLTAKIKDLTSDNKGYVDKIHYLEKKTAAMEVMIKDNNNKKQAAIKAKDKELNKKMQEFRVKETEFKQLLGFKAESIQSKSEFEKEIKALKSANDSFEAQLKKMKALEI